MKKEEEQIKKGEEEDQASGMIKDILQSQLKPEFLQKAYSFQQPKIRQQIQISQEKMKDINLQAMANIDNLSMIQTQQQQPGFLINLTKNGLIQPEKPIIQNVVSTVNMCCKLDLKMIALRARNAEYNPKRFAAVIIRIRGELKTTALIFASGKMVCTGAKSELISKQASRQYTKIIQKLGFNVKFRDFKIQNIVASCDVKFAIKLEEIQKKHSNFCTYEPELFPGLIYKMLNPKIVLLIFVSGKLVLTGAKNRGDIYKCFRNMYTVLFDNRKKDNILQYKSQEIETKNK